MAVQDIIKSRRKELRLTLKEVAERLHVSEGTVSRYESGDIQNMGIDKIAALAKALECSPGYLMGWENEPITRSKDVPAASSDLTPLEKQIVRAYRVAPEGIQDSVCKLLDVKRDPKDTSTEVLDA